MRWVASGLNCLQTSATAHMAAARAGSSDESCDTHAAAVAGSWGARFPSLPGSPARGAVNHLSNQVRINVA